MNSKYVSIIFCLVFCNELTATSTSEDCLQDDINAIDTSFDITPHMQHISKFSLVLFKNVLPHFNKTDSVILSPYTIWNGLALAYLGSKGETEQQLSKVLGIRSKIDALKMWRAAQYLYKTRQFEFQESHFGVVSKGFFDKNLKIRPCLLQLLQAEIGKVDFSSTVKASSVINDFVSKGTNGHITSVTSPTDLNDASMALVNAAFFKDSWKIKFDRTKTKDRKFYSYDGRLRFVEMMKAKGQFKHGISKELDSHVLELQYTMKDISMYIVLPPLFKGMEGLTSMIENMSPSILEKAIQNIWLDNIDVTIPKMKMSTSLDSVLKKVLKNMGVKDLFEANLANLTALIPEGQVSVSKTLHQTFVEVNEEGTEAASSTVVIGTGRSARPSRLQSFVCDHPFVFFIYDKTTKNILFSGLYQ